MELTLRKLASVVALAETQNYARAAERLGISQPALSRTIAGLETRFGVRLFDRGRGGVTVTPAGEILLADARRLGALARTVEHNMRQIGSGEGGLVRIGMGPLPASLLLRRVLAETLRARPRLRTDCTVDAAERLLPLLAEGALDFCVFSEVLVPEGAVHSIRTIGSPKLGLYVRAGHPLAHGAPAGPDELARFPLACGHHRSPIAVFGLIESTVASDDFLMLRELMLESDCVFLCGHGLVADDIAEGRAVELVLAGGWTPPAARLVLVRNAGHSHSPAAWEAMDRVATIFAALPGDRMQAVAS